MSVVAMAHQSAILLGEEVTFGVAVARTHSVPALSESLQVDEGIEVSGAMRADLFENVASQGPRTASGGINLAPDAVGIGKLLKGIFAFTDSAELDGKVDLAPTITPTAGGSLTSGSTYRYKISAVVQHDADGTLRVLNPSPEQPFTPGSGNLTAALAWGAPAEVPDNYTLVRYVVWRTEANGSAGSQKWLAITPDSTASYTDTGAATLDNEIGVPAPVFRHAFKRGLPAAGNPKSFTLEVLKGNGSSELYLGFTISTVSIGLQPNGLMTFDINGIAKDMQVVTSSTPAFSTAADPFMGHATFVYFYDEGEQPEGTFSLATQLSLSIDNKAQGRRTMNNSRTISRVKFGRHSVTGQLMRELDDMDTAEDVLDGATRAIRTETFANNVAKWEKEVAGLGIVQPWAYQIGFELPRVLLRTHQAPSSGEDAIVQTVGLHMLKDANLIAPLRVTLDNLTPGY